MLDLLQRRTNEDELRYPIIHLKGEDIEVAITHNNDYGEEIFSFVNGQYTTQGGTHQQAFREAFVKVIRDFYKKDYEASDIRQSIVAAIRTYTLRHCQWSARISASAPATSRPMRKPSE